MRRRYPLLLVLVVACTSHGSNEPPSAERAAAVYLAVHNEWDEEAARALWGPMTERVHGSIDWLRAQVGSCTDFSPIHAKSELQARFVFECERGQIEFEPRVDKYTGELQHYFLGARGVEPPAHVRQTAEQLVALANGKPAIQPTTTEKFDQTEVRAVLDTISAQGPCRIDRIHLASGRGARFVLECAEGSMAMLVDLDHHGAIRRFAADKGAPDTWREQG
jgi:hypothetical protein